MTHHLGFVVLKEDSMKQYNSEDRLRIYEQLESERPLVIKPQLAKEIGLNEAIILQQIKYWLAKSKHKIQNEKWVYNSLSSWQEQFPFFSISTIKRTLNNLIKMNLIKKGRFNKKGYDRTNWYALVTNDEFKMNQSTVQDEPMQLVKMNPPIPYNTTYINSDTNELGTVVILSNEALSKFTPAEFDFDNFFRK